MLSYQLLTTKQAARELKVGLTTLEKMRAEGRGPAYVRPDMRRVLYRSDHLEAWIEANTKEFDR